MNVLFKDVLHTMSNNGLMCYVTLLWPSSGWWYWRMYYLERQTTVW